jgi:hypothetical protein
VLKVDAVSGATYSSRAIIGNMQRGLAYAAKTTTEKPWYRQIDVSAKAIAGLVVALMAAIVPLFYPVYFILGILALSVKVQSAVFSHSGYLFTSL